MGWRKAKVYFLDHNHGICAWRPFEQEYAGIYFTEFYCISIHGASYCTAVPKNLSDDSYPILIFFFSNTFVYTV